ncbi:MAG: NAD-dependent epimerase/dehydratase family protein, partial [Candidatus Gottesmanbacteria bacterium]
MNILLTGSNGFIGSNIATHLKGKHTLFTPGHRELDLLDEEAVLVFFKSHAIDLVIHCALVGGSRKEEYIHSMFYDNMRMFFNIVRCKKYFRRMINIG